MLKVFVLNVVWRTAEWWRRKRATHVSFRWLAARWRVDTDSSC